MEKNLFQLMQLQKQKNELATIVSYNQKTEQFGLRLTDQDAKALILCRDETLKKYRRVEFGTPILEKVIFSFCDSQYINQDGYAEILARLQDVFYEFKNESEDNLTDDELLTFMREQFEGVCFGDLDYLEGTCLERFAEAIRAGYSDYQRSGGSGEYEQFDQEPRWDRNVYLSVLKELFWG